MNRGGILQTNLGILQKNRDGILQIHSSDGDILSLGRIHWQLSIPSARLTICRCRPSAGWPLQVDHLQVDVCRLTSRLTSAGWSCGYELLRVWTLAGSHIGHSSLQSCPPTTFSSSAHLSSVQFLWPLFPLHSCSHPRQTLSQHRQTKIKKIYTKIKTQISVPWGHVI